MNNTFNNNKHGADLYVNLFQKDDFLNKHDAEFFYSIGNENNYVFENYSSPSAFFVYTNNKLIVLKYNQKYLNETLFKPEDHNKFGIEPWNFIEEESKQLYKKTIQKAIATQEEQTCDTWRNTFSQSCGKLHICLKVTIKLIAVHNNHSFLLYVTVQNVTDEKQKYQITCDSETKFRNAAEQANVYAWEYTISTHEMRPCSRCMRDLGLPPVVKNYPEPVITSGLFPPDYADLYREWHKHLALGVKSLEAVIPLTKDRIPFHVRYTTEFNSAGEPIKAYGSAAMVIENQRDLELREIMNTVSFMSGNIVKIDLNKNTARFIQVNDYVPHIFNDYVKQEREFKYKEFTEKYIKNHVHPDDLEMVLKGMQPEYVRKKLKEDDIFSMTFRTVHDGVQHYLNVKYFALSKDNNIISFIQNVDEAVTTQKNNEIKLEQALTTAKQAVEAKNTFLSNMSHDIRTPLNGIIGLLEINDNHADDLELITRNRKKMRIAANHLLSLINDILDLTKMEDSHTSLVHEPFCIKDVLSDVELISGSVADNNNIYFKVENDWHELKHPYLYGSPLHIKRILINLINNSIKYNKIKGSVTLTTKETLNENRVFYTWTIKDTGIGMSEDFQKKMFVPFSQEHSDENSVNNGTGLGLSIVKALIDKMNGSIKVESQLGVGSTFTITIPFDVASPKDMPGHKPAKDILKLTGKRILIVEDNDLNAEICNMLLTDAGANVFIAHNGKLALEYIQENAPYYFDAVLMDVKMPVMNGLEATTAIRKLNTEYTDKLPIIAMTASTFTEDIKKCLSSGMNSHLAKPIDVKQVLTTLNNFMN